MLNREEIEDKALRQRKMHDLGTEITIGNKVFDIIENQYESFLLLYPLKSRNIAGFTRKKSDFTQIFINTSFNRGFQNFAAAHELYHLIQFKEREKDNFILCKKTDIVDTIEGIQLSLEELNLLILISQTLLLGMMIMMKKIESPVLFDANILINFKGQLKFLFSFFKNILVHKKVIEEVLEESIINELNIIMEENNTINIVEDIITDNESAQLLYKICNQELKNTFNIKDAKDLGEYKTLLYAKFNEVKLLSSQDTTVWRFVTDSTYFNDIECITIQDLAYLIYLNAN